MTTSGSTDFSIDRSGLITAALEDLGVLGEGGTASSSQLSHGATRLNLLVKSLGGQLGLPLWALKVGYILPFTGTNSILATSHCVNSYTQTTVATAAAALDTSIVVASISGISNSDQLGIELDDGTIQWTTVNGVPAGSTVVAATGLSSAASVGNVVYAYTASSARISRPLRVVNAYTHDVVNDNDVQITIIPYKDYADLSNKSIDSYPTELYYDPQLTGNFFVYPRFSNGTRVIVMKYHRPFEDFDNATDTPDFPQEWFLPVQALLTWWLARTYGKSVEDRAMLKQEAMYWLDSVGGNDREEGSVILTPAENPEI